MYFIFGISNHWDNLFLVSTIFRLTSCFWLAIFDCCTTVILFLLVAFKQAWVKSCSILLSSATSVLRLSYHSDAQSAKLMHTRTECYCDNIYARKKRCTFDIAYLSIYHINGTLCPIVMITTLINYWLNLNILVYPKN